VVGITLTATLAKKLKFLPGTSVTKSGFVMIRSYYSYQSREIILNWLTWKMLNLLCVVLSLFLLFLSNAYSFLIQHLISCFWTILEPNNSWF
jgi:hypothetical protein